MNSQIGLNIRQCRESKGYSQEYMAHQLKLTQSAYAKIENNSTKMTVARLFDCFFPRNDEKRVNITSLRMGIEKSNSRK